MTTELKGGVALAGGEKEELAGGEGDHVGPYWPRQYLGS